MASLLNKQKEIVLLYEGCYSVGVGFIKQIYTKMKGQVTAARKNLDDKIERITSVIRGIGI
jgi:hypothetical protein